MPSRQMACQLTQPQVLEYAKKIVKVFDGRDPKDNPKAVLEAAITDQKELVRVKVTLMVLDRLRKVGCWIEDVKKVICWRDEKGEPDDIHVELTNEGAWKRRHFEIYSREAEVKRSTVADGRREVH